MLNQLLHHYPLRAGVFYTGNICGRHDFERDTQKGHLHVIRRGHVELQGPEIYQAEISEPTLVFLPRPEQHRLMTDLDAGADVVCGTVVFGAGGFNPIVDSLPDMLFVKLADMPRVEAVLDMLFEEALLQTELSQAILDRLCEVLIIRLLMHSLEHKLATSGSLAGLADSRLSKVLDAIHTNPAADWSLQSMAQVACMSRARFAAHFKQVTGATPAHYLSSWRLAVAQTMLRSGASHKQVASDVGFANSSALARSFARHTGVSPSQWMRTQDA